VDRALNDEPTTRLTANVRLATGFPTFDRRRWLGAAACLAASLDKGCAVDPSDALAKLGINAGSPCETKKRQNGRVPYRIKSPARKPDAKLGRDGGVLMKTKSEL
jgi:hypothetical protein